MGEDDELFEDEARKIEKERLAIEEIEAEIKEAPIEDNENEQPERKLLRREIQAQSLKRLENSARTAEDFQKVVEWWDRLDANRERRERYYEILRDDEEVPFEYGASAYNLCFPDNLNGILAKQRRQGDFLDDVFNCPYELHELVTDEYISNALKDLNEDQKFLMYLWAIKQFSTTRIASMKEQSDRNIRKVRVTMIKKIQKKILPALIDKAQRQQPLTIWEKNFLKMNRFDIDKKKKR